MDFDDFDSGDAAFVAVDVGEAAAAGVAVQDASDS